MKINALSFEWLMWAQRQPWLSDFHDARVRAEVVNTLYTDSIMPLAINVFASVILYFVYDFVPNMMWFCVTLLIWSVLAVVQMRGERQVKLLFKNNALSDALTWFYLLLYVLGSVLQFICLACVLSVFLLRQVDVLSFHPVVIGVLFYYFAAVMKDFPVRLLSLGYTLLLFVPMIVYYMWQGTVSGWIMAALTLMFVFGTVSFSSNVGRAFISQIHQRYELETLAQRLVIEKDRADAANQAKSRFFTAASHDARQPLQAIGLLYDSIASSSSMDVHDRKALEKIGANLHAIRNLFNRVLDISRIESGSVVSQIQPIRLQDVFNALDAQLGEFAASKNLWLRFVPTPVTVLHDRDLLERMTVNIIHNALKFTEHGGVWVAYRHQRGVLEIRDSGIGIAAEDQMHVFEEFHQLDNSARKRNEGMGLGLSIVRRLAELTHTRIGIRSQLGQGSVFCLSLQVMEGDEALMAHAPHTTAQEASLVGLSIVLVEDDDELRTLFTTSLMQLGATVNACATAQEAVQCFSNHAFTSCDVLLTDYRLGHGATGVDVAKCARECFRDDLPIILLTGDTSGFDDVEWLKQSNAVVLHKPVTLAQLMAHFPEVRL